MGYRDSALLSEGIANMKFTGTAFNYADASMPLFPQSILMSRKMDD